MSPDTDRIAVPTNGRGPHPAAAPAEEPSPAEPAEPADTLERLSGAELSNALSPKQLAVGFGILVSLVLLVAGRARRRR